MRSSSGLVTGLPMAEAVGLARASIGVVAPSSSGGGNKKLPEVSGVISRVSSNLQTMKEASGQAAASFPDGNAA